MLSSTCYSIRYIRFQTSYELQLAKSEDYHDTARAARYLSIISFEIQLCNELDMGMYKEMLKQKNQDGAYLSSTEKANLMIAFIVKTVLDNYGDLAESEFAQHKDSSDADEVRKYAESLIKKIKLLFPTAQTYREGLEYAGVSMKNFDEGLNKICQDIQDKENTFGRKLFGLSYSKRNCKCRCHRLCGRNPRIYSGFQTVSELCGRSE